MNKLFLLTLVLFSCAVLIPGESSAQTNRTASGRIPGKNAGDLWETQAKKAFGKARRERKNILINFTGSDWCTWCIKLDNEVFSKPAFKKYAAKNLILLKIDFPRNKWQTPEEKNINSALAKRYAVRGFPTILLLDDKGQVIARTGYKRGGASAYVRHLRQLQQASR